MNFLAIISLIFLMNYSKSRIAQKSQFSENKLLQVKQVFLTNFNKYLVKQHAASNIKIDNSLVGINDNKQIFLKFNYNFINEKDQTHLSKSAQVIIEPTANTHEWIVKKVINNTEEIKFNKDFIINL